MANPTPGPSDFRAQLSELRRALDERIDRISTFDGSQYVRAVEKLQELINDLPGMVDDVLATAVNTGNVNATGNVTANGQVNAISALKSAGAAGTNLGSIPGNRQTVWQIYDGPNAGLYGYAPSSITTKTNLKQVPYSAASFLLCAAYLYEYKDQVAMRNDPESEYYDPEYEVPQEVGYMAEHLIENGLKQFVTIRDGEPIGIDYAAFASVGMTVVGRDHAAQIAQLWKAVEALQN